MRIPVQVNVHTYVLKIDTVHMSTMPFDKLLAEMRHSRDIKMAQSGVQLAPPTNVQSAEHQDSSPRPIFQEGSVSDFRVELEKRSKIFKIWQKNCFRVDPGEMCI